jgi:ligand-binding SRPBCC domain-containing protein
VADGNYYRPRPQPPTPGLSSDRVARLLVETVIDAGPERCFELSLSVDAHLASMGESRERAIDGVTTGTMRLGDTVTWQARHFGLRFRMTSEITVFERPWRFVDEQVRGPFRYWRHEHTFSRIGPNRTRMTDDAQFAAPAGPAGRLVERLVLTRYLTGLLEQRNRWLRDELERA